MCLDTSPPSRLHYHQQCHSHTAPQRSLEGPMQTTSNQRWQTNKTTISVQFQTQKMQIAMSKRGRLLIFGHEETVETETVETGTVLRESARLSSVHQR